MEGLWEESALSMNEAMVQHLQQFRVLKSKKVAEVMESIDRALFVPAGVLPYINNAIGIGYNATITAPCMHATCLEHLEMHLQPGMHALDVGSGSGYITACIAMMVGPQGRAIGVEHIPELAVSSIKNIQKSVSAPLLKNGSLSIHVGDGRLGWVECGPYDCIHVGAAAEDIPIALVEQLKPGGRMVIPIGNLFQHLRIVDKNLDGSISMQGQIVIVNYVPLTSREQQMQGSRFGLNH